MMNLMTPLMTPWRKRTPQPLSQLRTEMDDLWNRFFDDTNGYGFPSHLPEAFTTTQMPALNVTEDENAFRVDVDLPGVDPKEVNVEVVGNELVISGERKWESKKEEKDFVRMESQFGAFRRVLPLGSGLRTNPEDIEAKYKNGILKIHLKKMEPTPTKKIEVSAD